MRLAHELVRRERHVVRGFLSILSGTALGQVVVLAATPILSRLYAPEDAASYTLLLGVSAVIAAFATLKLDLAIPIAQSIEESRRLFWMAVTSAVLILAIVGLGVGAVSWSGLWTSPRFDWVDYCAIALFVLLLCSFTAASQLAIRTRAYGLLGRIPVLQMLGTVVAQIGLGLVGFSRGLFIGGMVGRSLGMAKLVRAGGVRMSQYPDRPEATRLLKRYWRFPAVFAPASVVEVLGGNIAAIMLPALYGFGPAGLYAMAIRVTAVPSAVVSQSAGQVFLGEFARTRTREAALRVFTRWSIMLCVLGTIVAGGVWLTSPILLPPVLGPDWDGTVVLAQYAGVMAGAAIIGSPLQHVWTVRQRGDLQFGWNILRLCVTAGVIWFGAKSGQPLQQVVKMLAVGVCVVYAASWAGTLFAAASPRSDDLLDLEAQSE